MSQFVCAYQIRFSDGGEPEEGLLHVGSQKDCERMAELIPGVSYSGPRPVLDCRIGVFPAQYAEPQTAAGEKP